MVRWLYEDSLKSAFFWAILDRRGPAKNFVLNQLFLIKYLTIGCHAFLGFPWILAKKLTSVFKRPKNSKISQKILLGFWRERFI
jgi:hypothetical protein